MKKKILIVTQDLENNVINITKTLIEHDNVPNNMIWDQINNHKFWMETMLWVVNGKHN